MSLLNRPPRTRARKPFFAGGLLPGLLLGVLLASSPMHAVGEEENPYAPLDEEQFEELVEVFRDYFNLDLPLYEPRITIRERFAEWRKKDIHVLADMDLVRAIVNKSRWFVGDLTDKKWQRERGIDAKEQSGIWNFKSDELLLAFSFPDAYPSERDLNPRKGLRPDPLPVLVTLNDKEDYTGERYPGTALMKRRWPKSDFEGLYENWLTVTPIAPAGNYLDEEGAIKPDTFLWPLMEYFKYVHMDFSRVILDGTEPVIKAAPNYSLICAGLIMRAGELDEDDKKLVPNYAHVPVYVVSQPDLADALEAAGHQAVTRGDESGLLDWMNQRKRVLPRKFTWNVLGQEHQFAWWVNIRKSFSGSDRSLEVEVIDTEDNPNTINIDTKGGITELRLFLNDEIVDLSRPVRVVVNGNLEHDAMLERDLDTLFMTPPFNVRSSMWFGNLFTSGIFQVRVRARATTEEGTEEGAEGTSTSGPTEADIEKAANLLEGAKTLISRGKTDGARKRLQMILDMGFETPSTEEAKQILASLDG